MKTRSILPFAVLGLLLALLLAVSACGGGGDDGFDASRFGGPYPFASTATELIDKKLDFECYEKLGLSLSKAVKLTEKLFKDSIEENYNFPDGTVSQKYDTQKYNFVIDTKGNIIVAKWKDVDLAEALDNAEATAQAWDDDEATATSNEQQCGGRRCKVDGDFKVDDSNRDLEGIMVNFFPEEKEADPQISPCWLDGNEKKRGLLDAISKHLLLAQGKDTTIAEFEWIDGMVADVAYAGQIVVDLHNCAYWVNGDSGTYRPDRDTMLARAQQHFAKQVSITVPDVSGKCELSLPRPTPVLADR